MPHVVLIGDSILDNGAYTLGGPDVVSHVREFLPPGWDATLLAVDGATTDHVAGQLDRLPEDATHLVLSVGGNNALKHLQVLDAPVSSMVQSVEMLADIASEFERRYRVAVEACLATGRPLTIGLMTKRRKANVHMGTSADGFIARPDGDLEWLTSRPAPAGFYGMNAFMKSVDTKVLGRKTYEESLKLGATSSAWRQCSSARAFR